MFPSLTYSDETITVFYWHIYTFKQDQIYRQFLPLNAIGWLYFTSLIILWATWYSPLNSVPISIHLFLTSILSPLPIPHIFLLVLARLYYTFFLQSGYLHFLVDGHSCNCSLFGLHFHSTLYPTFFSNSLLYILAFTEENALIGLQGKIVEKIYFSDDSILDLWISLIGCIGLNCWGVLPDPIYPNEGNASIYHSSHSLKGTGLLSVERRVWEGASANKFLTVHIVILDIPVLPNSTKGSGLQFNISLKLELRTWMLSEFRNKCIGLYSIVPRLIVTTQLFFVKLDSMVPRML